MHKSLLLFIGLAIGGAAGYFAPRPSDQAVPVELAQAKTEISRLQTRLSASESSLAKRSEDKTTVASQPSADGKMDIKKLMADAKPLLKSITSSFEPRRKEMMSRMMDEQLKRITAAANLTPEQQAAFRSYLEEQSAADQAKWQSALDGNGGFEQLFQNGRGGLNQSKAMDEWAQQNLTGEQATAYQASRLTEKAKQVTDSANARLESMSSSLKLDETQKDQVFDILVQTDKNYDPSMKLEGAGKQTAITGTKEEAIAAVLTPTQQEQYAKQQQERQRRGGGFFNGFGKGPAKQPATEQ